MERKINLGEQHLATNINDLSREVMHDLFVACRKAGIYSIGHPMVSKAVARPFLNLQKVFGFKKYFTLVLFEGQLYANNILMSDIGVVDYLKEKMHEREITTILFEDTMTVSDLEVFIDRFVKRLPSSNPDYMMHRFLENRKIFSIRVDSSLADKIFRAGLRYRDDVGEDLSARALVANYFSGDIQLAVTVLGSRFTDTEKLAAATGIDYHTELVNHILPEKFAQLPPSELVELADHILTAEAALDDSAADRLERLVRTFDYHPRRDELLEQIRKKLVTRGGDEEVFNQSLSQAGTMKLEVAHAVDDICRKIFSDDGSQSLYGEFHDAFVRLVRTRQMGKATSVTEAVIGHLASDTARCRQHAIYLLEDIIKSGLSVGEYEFLDIIIRHLQVLFTQGRETFEFSEVVIYLLQSMLSLRRFEPVSTFLNVLKSGRRTEGGTVVYDSVTVKRIFDELDDPEIISRLVRELEQRGNSLVKPVREILAAIQSEEVALQLAAIVAHRERSVRQHSLKVLSELGWPAVRVFSDVLRDESNFFRPEGRHELPDEKWFFVRNAIFVLGNLKNPGACNALRLRLSDPDIRVRRELVKALEKIGGDEAVDLLIILAEDADSSIRELAIITLGLFKRPDLVPFFIDVLSRQKGEIQRTINAIAMTDSPEGRDYLASLLHDHDRLKALASGKASIADIRAWVLKALGKPVETPASRKADETKTKAGKGILSRDSGLGKTAQNFLNKFQTRR